MGMNLDPSGPPPRRLALRLAFVVAALVLALAPGPGGLGCAAEPPAPNIVLITLDTTRADHLGSYGYFRETSPAIDAFAAQSIVFERAIVPMATTLPTHTSLLTAAWPIEHGVLANTTQGGERFVASARLRSFASVAREAGYRTAAFVSAAPLYPGSGIEAGFDTFDHPQAQRRRGEATTVAALAWLDRNRTDPFFLWVHYYDAHWPFEAPAPYGEMFHSDAELKAYTEKRRFRPRFVRKLTGTQEEALASVNAYDGEIRYQDAQVERLLSALRARPDWERTAVLLVGDHGEGLGQHDHAAHGGTWDEQLHAPLIMRVPGEPPRRVAHTVSVVDALPTLLRRLDAPTLEVFLGQASGGDALTATSRNPVLSQDSGRVKNPEEYRYALTSDRWKYVRAERRVGPDGEALYDLGSDPFELRDVAHENEAIRRELATTLDMQLSLQRKRRAELHGGGPDTRAADPAVVEQLRALGYLEDEDAAGGPGAGGGGSR